MGGDREIRVEEDLERSACLGSLEGRQGGKRRDQEAFIGSGPEAGHEGGHGCEGEGSEAARHLASPESVDAGNSA